jgi:sulfur carrier protein ThiS
MKGAGDGTPLAPIACGRRISYGVREVPVRVRVKLFASLCRYLSDAAPGIPFEMKVPEGTTMANLMDRLKLPREEVKVVFVNGRARPMDWPLEPGDDVGIFPLVAGG